MKVRAVRMGYYGHRRRPEGSVFNIADKPLKKDGKTPSEFGDWMEEVKDASTPVKDTKIGQVTVNPNAGDESRGEGSEDVI